VQRQRGGSGLVERTHEPVCTRHDEDRLRKKTRGQARAHEVDALDQEGALALTVLAQVQRRGSLDERVLATGDRVA
jgi:hypothetical protein